MHNTVDSKEVIKFAQLSDQWWDTSGKFKTLHQINPVRIKFIKDSIDKYHSNPKGLQNLSVLDVGCGGGILSEPLANLGANLTSIDPSQENIEAAMLHATNRDIKINYQVGTTEDLIKDNHKFDVIICIEVIEHVANLAEFINQLSQLLKAEGVIIFSTINRTVKSYILAIGMAEYILRLLPRGTHSWSKFIKPHELYQNLEASSLSLLEFKGLKLDIIQNKWCLSDNLDVNYFAVAKKKF